MKILSWNCRGLREPYSISHLKEFLRLYLIDLVFLYETKQSTSFVKKTVKKLHFDNRWQVSEPDGRKGGMLVAWSQRVEITHRWTNELCVELRLNYESESTDV